MPKVYDIGSGLYAEITDDELEAIAVQGTHTIEIDQFVPKDEIDEMHWASDAGRRAFSVARDAIKKEHMVALGRVVFTTREHVIAIEPRGKGTLGLTLGYPYEVRDQKSYFGDITAERSPTTCLIWLSGSSDQRPGISSRRNSKITMSAHSKS